MNTDKLELKKLYIPRIAKGEISIRRGAQLIGIAPLNVWKLKNKYLEKGDRAFIHGNTGRRPHNKRIDDDKIISFYRENFNGAPFAVVRDVYAKDISPISYSTVFRTLSNAGVMSPRAHKPVREKKKHLPRKERPNEGDLIQIDGSKHEWLIGQKKTCIHGAIDDATHKITALYMCENECLLGYYELLRQTAERMGGFPRAIYSDRSSCFFITKQSLDKVSIKEQLAGMRETRTQWQEVCEMLNIELIAALSPEAKGRIERLWETLQGRLPWLFKYLGINTIQGANEFLRGFVDSFNAQFSVDAVDPAKHWQRAPQSLDLDFIMSVRNVKHTQADGSFVYHGYKFGVVAARSACIEFTLCLNARYGIKAYRGGKYYPVELREELGDVVGDRLSIVEKSLIEEYLLSDTHERRAKV